MKLPKMLRANLALRQGSRRLKEAARPQAASARAQESQETSSQALHLVLDEDDAATLPRAH